MCCYILSHLLLSTPCSSTCETGDTHDWHPTQLDSVVPQARPGRRGHLPAVRHQPRHVLPLPQTVPRQPPCPAAPPVTPAKVPPAPQSGPWGIASRWHFSTTITLSGGGLERSLARLSRRPCRSTQGTHSAHFKLSVVPEVTRCGRSYSFANSASIAARPSAYSGYSSIRAAHTS